MRSLQQLRAERLVDAGTGRTLRLRWEGTPSSAGRSAIAGLGATIVTDWTGGLELRVAATGGDAASMARADRIAATADPLAYCDYVDWQQGLEGATRGRAAGSRLAFERDGEARSLELVRSVPAGLLGSDALRAEARLLAGWRSVLDSAAEAAADLFVTHPGRPIEEMEDAFGAYAWADDSPHAHPELAAAVAEAMVAKALRDAREMDCPPIDYPRSPGWRYGFIFLQVDDPGTYSAFDAAPEPALATLGILWAPSGARLFLTLAEAPWPQGWAERLLDRLLATLASRDDQRPFAVVPGAAEHAALLPRPPSPTAAPFFAFPRRVLAHRTGTVALRMPERSLDYAGLAGRVESAAAALAGHGVRPGAIVGHHFADPLDGVVAMLAIQHAAATPALFDPAEPPARIETLLLLVGASLLISDGRRVEGVGSLLWSELSADGFAAPDIRPGDGAYILFTSGTTGRPKAVRISHGALEAYRSGIGDRLPLAACRTSLMVTPLSVDLGFTMLLSALGNGTTLALVPPAIARDGNALADFVAEADVDALKITPTHLRALMLAGGRRLLPASLLVTGGERMDPDLAAACRGPALANHYGPAEATVGIAAGMADDRLALGPPLAEVTIAVFDARLQPVGFGTIGELYLGGPQLADGYAGDGAATAAAFIPSPWDQGGRLYRTGDLVRQDPDGTLHFVARVESGALKRAGRRIDPEEIRAACLTTDGVADAAILVRGDRIDAYATLVPSPPDHEDEAALLAGWKALFEASHVGYDLVGAIDFARFGWLSSYDHAPLPHDDIAEQVGCIAERALELSPARVLEIGCGTGSLVRAIAPATEHYVAVDPSPTMLEAARQAWRRIGGGGEVRFAEGAINRFESVGEQCFDLILINSVVQYLPSFDYLERAIADLAQQLAPNGHILLGDVRDLALLPAQRADRAAAGAPARDDEIELLLTAAACARLGRASGLAAEVLLKRGRRPNELNRFRFDVRLSRAEPVRDLPAWPWTGPDDAARRLGDAPFVIRDIPNAWIANRARTQGGDIGCTPERLHALLDLPGSPARLTPADRPGDLHAIVGVPAHVPVILERAETAPMASKPLEQARATRTRERTWHWLAAHLPPHMMPDSLTVIAALPRGPSGKLDPTRLPQPDHRASGSRAARSADEAAILEALRQVLGSDMLGVDDDFFAMGGHSLLAIRALIFLRERTGRAPPLRAMFEGATSAAALARLLDGCASSIVDAPAIRGDGPFPVTEAEARILDEADPDHSAFVIAFAAVIEGPLDSDALERALAAIGLRHESWRSGYRRIEGDWRRVLSDRAPVTLARVDLSASDAPLAAARALAETIKMQPFELARPPLARALLMKLGPERHALAFAVHHIISDGWSTGILAEELSQLYRAAQDGKPVETDTLDYAQVAFAEQARMPSRDLDAWCAHLADIPPDLPWPVGPRSVPQDRRGASIGVQVDARLSIAARRFGRKEKATLFCVLAAAWAVTLADLARVDALTIGTPVATRRSTASERMLGCFINLVALPARIPAGATFRDLVARMKTAMLWSFEHGDTGFGRIAAKLEQGRPRDRPPVFQAMIELANMPAGALRLDGATVSALDFDHGTSEFELNLILRETDSGLSGWLIHRTTLLDADGARALFARFVLTLEAGVAAAEKPLRDRDPVDVK